MRRTREVFDAATNTLYVEHREDVEPLMNGIAEFKGENTDGYNKERTWRKIGSIPLIVVEKVLREEGINLMGSDSKAIARARQWLNDNYKFRTVDKRLN